MVYTFKPAGDVTFTKAVFSSDGAGSDYLIHSISYKEVSEGDSTTIVGSDEVAFKISTSNIPDPSKYDFKTTFPTADVKIVDKNSGEVLFEKTVNLDKNGNAIVTVRTDGTKDLKAEVSNVQGNFEEVDYKNAKTEVEASIKATASNDSFDTLEDTNYVLKTTDFGDKNQNVAKIKFDSLPANGTIYVLKSEYTGSINDRAEYTSSENKVYIEVKAGDIVDISKIENGNVVFVPENNTDADSSFNFSVSNGNGVFTGSYETKVNVIADADVPETSINITKIGATTIVVDGDTGNSNNDGNNSIGGIVTENFWEGYNSKEDIMTNSTHNENSIGWQNPFTSNSDNVDINGNQTQWIDTQDGNDNVYISENAGGINTGNGDDRVFIKGNVTNNINLGSGNDELHIKGNSSTIDAGDGDDKVKIEGNANNDIQLRAGNDSLEIKGNASSISTGDGDDKIKIEGNSNGTIELGSGNNYLEIKGNATSIQVGGDSGNDRVIVNGNATNNISLGKGDDYLELGGKILNYVDGGEGNNDSVYLKGYTLSEYQSLIANGNEWKVKNFENIKLGDGTIVKGDGSVFETSKPENIIKAVEYKVDISAALTDTDGSETLSVVIKNVPTGAVLESTKYDVSKNSDGSWSVNFKEGTTGDALLKIEDSLTMKVPESDKGEINLQIEARATETRDNEDKQNFKVTTDSDAVVTTVDETSNITVDKEGNDTNLVLVLDVSGSMVRTQKDGGGYTPVDLDGKGTTRFDVLKQSMISTIETYKAGGNTMVNMTLFAAGAKNLGWMIADEAIDYLNKLTMDKNAIVKHDGKKVLIGIDTGDNGKNTSDKFVESNQTDYRDALDETIRNVKMEYSGQASVKAVGYFVSDGAPNENTNKVNSSNTTIIKTWKEFIESNNIDLKVIGVGTPEDNKSALKYLKIVNVGGEDVIVIDEPSSIETIILGTVEGTILGDVSDNISGGDGKITIDSIEVNDIVYTRENMPKNGLQIDGEGKLLFDFETGKYAYNGNGADITEDKTKSFKVNVRDEDGDENSFNVNFELNKEQNDGVFSFKEGGDINFSNLENIVNLKEINLDNGKENQINLTLDDVLKLSGDDGKIKITGDQFDSVVFKDTKDSNGMSQSWSKTAGEGVDKGFDIYVNSGDSTVQVKVEQPISDGITN